MMLDRSPYSGQIGSMDVHKFITSTGTLVTAAIAIITLFIAGITWLVSLNANVSDLQRRVVELEKRPVTAAPAPNPVAQACIDLAKSRAATDQKPAMTSETEKAMNDLGCMRLN